jgi:hypothetical protein
MRLIAVLPISSPAPKPLPGIAVNEHYVGHGEIVYQQARKLGCEGIESKRLGSTYRSGRSKHWVKIKNPAAPAVRREAEEDWGADGRHDAHQAAFDVPLCSR